ncbi:MAG: hypothetical protein OXR84_08205 [Magnetovibrio sp.]|nr:hypothetical protein [Magnetovibrio sp.]
MYSARTAPNISNASYQRQLALSLVTSLGLEKAINTCLENGWTGTLGMIMKSAASTEVH